MSDSDRSAAVDNLKAPPIHNVIVIQFLTSVLAAIVSLLLLDTIAAYSVLLGGLTSALPNGFFARMAFRYRGARNVARVVKSFYAGEVGKLAMTAVLFALVFATVRPLNEAAVIIGFIITVIAGLVAAAYMNIRYSNQPR